MRIHHLAALAAGAMLLASASAQAATATNNLAVSATVTNSCTVAAATLSFGTNITSLAAAIDVAPNISVTCTFGSTPINIGLSAGAGSGATVTARKMTSGSNTLNYSIFRDTGRTQNLGNTVGTDTLSGTVTTGGTAQNFPIYGRLPAQTIPAAGAFTDTVGITVTY